jgi:glutamine synthetase
MIRVLAGYGDPESRLENRTGEPAVNPYLYFASQVVAGMDGVEHGLTPSPPETDPYVSANLPLPKTLSDALDAVADSELIRHQFGGIFMDYFVKLKQAELGRFNEYINKHCEASVAEEVTQWEQDEYFDFF